jgi:hypothetical protein
MMFFFCLFILRSNEIRIYLGHKRTKDLIDQSKIKTYLSTILLQIKDEILMLSCQQGGYFIFI